MAEMTTSEMIREIWEPVNRQMDEALLKWRENERHLSETFDAGPRDGPNMADHIPDEAYHPHQCVEADTAPLAICRAARAALREPATSV